MLPIYSDNILNDRTGRAGVVHNFMRGLSMKMSYPISPFTPGAFRKEVGFFENIDNRQHPKSVDGFDGFVDGERFSFNLLTSVIYAR